MPVPGSLTFIPLRVNNREQEDNVNFIRWIRGDKCSREEEKKYIIAVGDTGSN